jgi:hypothetical protein
MQQDNAVRCMPALLLLLVYAAVIAVCNMILLSLDSCLLICRLGANVPQTIPNRTNRAATLLVQNADENRTNVVPPIRLVLIFTT